MPDDILTTYAQVQPDKPAVIDDKPDGTVVVWTYAELEARSNRVANLLLSLGAGPGRKVLWCGPNSPEVVAVMSASRKIGAVAVPLNYRLTPEEALYVINHSDAEVAYVDYEHAPMFAALRDQLEKVRHIIAVGGPVPEPPDGMLTDADIAAAPADPPEVGDAVGTGGTMIYTSGTTGKPKGAVRSGAPDPEQIGALLNLFGYRPDDIYITSGPLYHSGPSAFMGAGMLFGQTIVVQRKFDAEDWLRLVDKYKVSSTFSAPALVRMICALPKEIKDRYDRSAMRVMLANAAPWSYALKQQYIADFPAESLFEIYGSTELGVDTVLLPADQLRKPGSCGQPAPGIEIVLFDGEGNEVAKEKASFTATAIVTIGREYGIEFRKSADDIKDLIRQRRRRHRPRTPPAQSHARPNRRPAARPRPRKTTAARTRRDATQPRHHPQKRVQPRARLRPAAARKTRRHVRALRLLPRSGRRGRRRIRARRKNGAHSSPNGATTSAAPAKISRPQFAVNQELQPVIRQFHLPFSTRSTN